jgi:hypothetical protein
LPSGNNEIPFFGVRIKELCGGGGGGQSFSWNWTSAKGHSGGTLVGVREGDLDAMDMGEGDHFSWVNIRNRMDGFCWEVINVYGHVKREFKATFLQDLYQKIQANCGPLMVGGRDFNMIRYPHEKSSGSENIVWMDMLNSFINDSTLIELIRGGSRFTWTNK